jgi:hypothetical protein
VGSAFTAVTHYGVGHDEVSRVITGRGRYDNVGRVALGRDRAGQGKVRWV